MIVGSSKELQESHEEPTSMPRLGASIATWNDDIIWEILQHLSLVPERPEDFHLQQLDDYYKLERLHRRTLASAALTCKAFSEPASQALWAVLPDGLLPLMHTFSNFRATSKTASNPTNYTLDGAIQDTEIQHFQHLAARVKYLAFSRPSRQSTPSAVDVILEQFETKNSPLFPNLRALEWIESSGDPHLSRLLRSLVRTSSLSAFIYAPNIYTPSTTDMSLFAALRPQLRHLRVWNYPSYLWGTSPLIPLRSLVSIHILAVDPSFFCHLATLAHLEDISISIGRKLSGSGQPEPSLPDSKTVVPGFKSLRRFATAGGVVRVENLVWMLSAIATSTRLSTLDIAVYQVALPALQEIGGMPVLQNLRTLNLRIYSGTYSIFRQRTASETAIKRNVPFSDIASPFYTIPSLEDVYVDVAYGSIVLTDGDLTRMQEAWPRLKTLVAFYDIDEYPQQPPGPSLASVVAFTMKMDWLEILDIEVAHVSAKDVDQLCALAEEGAVGHKLQYLTFAMDRAKFARDMDCHDAERLACALRRMFPRMRGVSSES